jgi:hypothetical protein
VSLHGVYEDTGVTSPAGLVNLPQIKGTISLIQNGARYNASKDTQAFFEKQQDRLLVFLMPSYFLDFNPIEYL